MKALKIGLTLFSMLVIVAFSSAQNDKSKMTKEEVRTEKIIDYVGLGGDVAEKARSLSVKYTDLINQSNDDAQKKEKIFQDLDVEVKALLTDEQYKMYEGFVQKEKDDKKKSSASRTERAKGAK